MRHAKSSPFEACALTSGLLTKEQLEEAWASLGPTVRDAAESGSPSPDQQIADQLVAMGRLNAWQAQQLLKGRTKFNLGPYQIIDSLGQGGMGHVFKASHTPTGRIVAVKVLPRDRATPEAVANFAYEIRVSTLLNHPRLVAALDAGQDGNVHYLVTEYVPGVNLRKLVQKEGPLPVPVAVGIINQVAEGLQCAHEAGIIHRDVKPGNILVTPDGDAKLADLGLAGPQGGGLLDDPRFGSIVGTADYLSPDQVHDPWNPTPAWDIYSLGCTLYYALTGRAPFPGGTTADKARAHRELRPLNPQWLNKQLSDDIVNVLAAMMAKDPAQRLPSSQAVRESLTPFLSSSPVPSGKDLSATPSSTSASPIPPVPPPVLLGNNAGYGESSRKVQSRASDALTRVVLPLVAFLFTPVAIVGVVLLLWRLLRGLWPY